MAVLVTIALLSSLGSLQLVPPTNATAALSFWFLTVGKASCSLVTGVCTMTMANTGNDSRYDLVLAAGSCSLDLIYFHNSTITSYTEGTGAAGGQIVNGIPYGTNETATCTIPTSQLKVEPNGWPATGSFTMELVNNLIGIPAGSTAGVGFQGTWSAPANVTYNTLTMTYLGPPTFTTSFPACQPCMWVVYRNNVNVTLTPTLWVDVENSLGQSVFVIGGPGLVGSLWNGTFGFSVDVWTVPAGNYTAFFFTTTSNGIVLSTTSEANITLP